MTASDRNYWNQSRSPLYSLIFTIPLFLIYEAGILLLSSDDIPSLRNGADVLMRQVLDVFGNFGVYGFGIIFLVGFILTFILQKQRWAVTNIRSVYLLAMFAESIAWSGVLFLFMQSSRSLLLITDGKILIQQLILAVGAGIYEEFVFRVLLISGLGIVLKIIFQWKQVTANIVSVILAAIIFSLFHFMGNFSDNFNFGLLIVRALAGIVLGVIYVMRGFGIVAYCHTFYDLAVLTILTTAVD